MESAEPASRCRRRKRRHLTREGADRHRIRMETIDVVAGRTRPGWLLGVYWCDECAAYHIGHRKVNASNTRERETIDEKP